MLMERVFLHHHIKVFNHTESKNLMPYMLTDNLPTAEYKCKIVYKGNGDYHLIMNGKLDMIIHSSNVKSAKLAEVQVVENKDFGNKRK